MEIISSARSSSLSIDETTPSATPLLVSACLLGEAVRYDGKALPYPEIAELDERGYWLVPCCPEVAGGLPVPRAAAEICHTDGDSSHRCVMNCRGEDVTLQFNRGAEAALALVKQHGIVTAILKEGSPSCGSQQIYDGSFSGRHVSGEGVTTALLRFYGVRVLSELRLSEL